MNTKPYTLSHKEACLAIFKSNMPLYFLPHELELFDDWLQGQALETPYFVAEKDGQLVACGGYFYDNRYEKTGLSWGMVHAALHGQGIGKKFTQFRIDKVKEEFPNQTMMIVTSQHTHQFYQRLGFVTQKITPNGFGEGLDEYLMFLSF